MVNYAKIICIFTLLLVLPLDIYAENEDIMRTYIGLSWNSIEKDIAHFASENKASIETSRDVRGNTTKSYNFEGIKVNNIGNVFLSIVFIEDRIENLFMTVIEDRKSCFRQGSNKPTDCRNNQDVLTRIAKENINIINSILGKPHYDFKDNTNSGDFNVLWKTSNAYVRLLLAESDAIELIITINRKTNYLKK